MGQIILFSYRERHSEKGYFRMNLKAVLILVADVYHVTFDWPIDAKLMNLLKAPPTLTTNEMIDRLVAHHRNMDGVSSRYQSVCRVVNADQPKSDVFSQGQVT